MHRAAASKQGRSACTCICQPTEALNGRTETRVRFDDEGRARQGLRWAGDQCQIALEVKPG